MVAAFGDERGSEQSERQRSITVLAGPPLVAREPEDGPSDGRTQPPEDQRARASPDPKAELCGGVVADQREDERSEPCDDRTATVRHRRAHQERDEQPGRDRVRSLRPAGGQDALEDLRDDAKPEADDHDKEHRESDGNFGPTTPSECARMPLRGAGGQRIGRVWATTKSSITSNRRSGASSHGKWPAPSITSSRPTPGRSPSRISSAAVVRKGVR